MLADPTARFWLIAGPNGVGKTTYAFKNIAAVSGSFEFVNLDEIARGLSPLKPELAQREAGRLALTRAGELIAKRRVFSMETTMSGHAHLDLMKRARSYGLIPSLLYFSAATPEICVSRIARRVAEGGHDVPEDIVRRRFERSLANLRSYCAEAELWRIYEASGARPQLAAEGSGTTIELREPDVLARAHPTVLDLIERMFR